MENFALSKSKIKLSVTGHPHELQGLPFLDMDANPSKPYASEDIEGMEAIKCDGDYYMIPFGETDLAKIATPMNQVPEHQVLGFVGMMKKYLIGCFDIKAIR